MRKLRNATVAIATASSVAIAGTTLAAAQEEPAGSNNYLGSLGVVNGSPNTDTSGSIDKIDKTGSLEFDQDATGAQLFGSSTGTWGSKDNPIPGSDITGENATDREHTPVWAQLLLGTAVVGLLGLIASPLAAFIEAPAFHIPAGFGLPEGQNFVQIPDFLWK